MGADVDCIGSNNDTALHVASINGEVHVVRLLLERGAKIDEKSKSGQTPLMLAASGGHYHPIFVGGNEMTLELLIQKVLRAFLCVKYIPTHQRLNLLQTSDIPSFCPVDLW